MVIFNELRINDDKTALVVDCYIEDVDGYDGLYIDSVYVDYYKNVSSLDSRSDKAIAIYTKDEEEDGISAVRCCLDQQTMAGTEGFGTDTFEAGMFVVTVVCGGTPANASILEQYGCGSDNRTDVGIVIDWEKVYRYGIQFAAQMAYGCGNSCDVPVGFEHFILLWNALKLAISTCDYVQASKLWPKFLRVAAQGDAFTSTMSSGCGCGR